jgi:hypothetical protein
MLSLDGNVLLGATTSQSSIGTVVVKEPHRSQVLRRFAAEVAQTDSALRARATGPPPVGGSTATPPPGCDLTEERDEAPGRQPVGRGLRRLSKSFE